MTNTKLVSKIVLDDPMNGTIFHTNKIRSIYSVKMDNFYVVIETLTE